MRISIFLITFLLTGFTQPIFSQELQEDVVYMNNGSFLRGKIVEMHPGQSLRLVYGGKDTISINMSDVKLIRKEDVPEMPNVKFENGVKTWGYTCIFELGYGQGLLEGFEWKKDTAESQYAITLSVFNGIILSPYIYLGIGTGIELWRLKKFIPIYLDFRSNLFKSANTPFLYVNAGYSPGWDGAEKRPDFGGAMAGIGAGAKIRLSKKQLITLSLGYRFQETHEKVVHNLVETKGVRDAHFVNFRMGFIF